MKTAESPKKQTQLAVADDPRWARVVARDRTADGEFWYSVLLDVEPARARRSRVSRAWAAPE